MKSVLSYIERAFCKLYKRNIYPSDDEVLKLFTEENIRKNHERIKEKKVIKVGFTFMSVALWKYDTIFQRMLQDKRYKPVVLVAPYVDKWDVRKNEIKASVKYCKEHKYPYISLRNYFFNIGQCYSSLGIDILFYTQPYSNLVCKEYYYDKAVNSLLCYLPYDNMLAKEEYSYNSVLHRIAYKLFYPFEENREISNKYGIDENKIVVSSPISYDYYIRVRRYSWNTSKKKIIWAPHSSIMPGDWLRLSCFLEIYDFMLELAQRYKNEIEIAFKPHPRLFSKLVSLWGYEKAKSYYDAWNELDNGFLFENSAYPLFKASDAMIHDCGAFVMDYMMTNKPCLYLLLNGDFPIDLIHPAKEALDAHYKAKCRDDIENFIKMIIDGRGDSKLKDRNDVMCKWIDNGRSATDVVLFNLI